MAGRYIIVELDKFSSQSITATFRLYVLNIIIIVDKFVFGNFVLGERVSMQRETVYICTVFIICQFLCVEHIWRRCLIFLHLSKGVSSLELVL